MKMHSGVHDGGRWMEEVGVLLVMSFSWGNVLGMCGGVASVGEVAGGRGGRSEGSLVWGGESKEV